MAKAQTVSIETLIANREATKAAFDAADKAMKDHVASLDVNTYLSIGGLPYVVVDGDKGKHLRCMLTKAAQMVQRGETPPPPKPRAKRTKPEEKA